MAALGCGAPSAASGPPSPPPASQRLPPLTRLICRRRPGPRRTPPPVAGRRECRSCPPKTGEIITVPTDLYRADIDTAGGIIAQVALLAHHDIADEAKPYLALQRTPERLFVAQSG